MIFGKAKKTNGYKYVTSRNGKVTSVKIVNPYNKPTDVPLEYLEAYSSTRTYLTKLLYGKTICLIGRAKSFEANLPVVAAVASEVDIFAFINYYSDYRKYSSYLDITYPQKTTTHIFYSSSKMNEEVETIFNNGDWIYPLLHFKNITRNDCMKLHFVDKAPGAFEFPHFNCKFFPNPDWHFVQSLFEHFKCSPLTGFIALEHLLSFNPKKIHIVGWNLYNQYRHDTGGTKRGNHDLEVHGKYLSNLVKNDSRIVLEDYFAKQLGL